MGFKIPRINLGMVDASEATNKDRLIINLTNGESTTGQLVLRLCNHLEGRLHRFCFDSASHNASLTEKLTIGGFITKDGNINYFPHISLVGLPSAGDRPEIEIYSDPRLQRRYILSALVGNFDESNVADLMQEQLQLTTV